MRKNYIVRKGIGNISLRTYYFAAILMAGIMVISSCKNKKSNNDAHADPGAVKIDSNLKHLLKPSNEQVVSTLPVIKAEYGTKIFTEEAQGVIGYDTRNQTSVSSRVSGRIERLLIRYNYQPVKKGQLIMEVYSPDLAAAQQELLFLKRSGDEAMMGSAKQRLLLLGMTASGINQVLNTGKVNYRVPVYSNADGYILEKSAAPAPAASAAMATPAAGGDGMDNMGAAPSAPGSAPAAGGNAGPATSPILLREGQYVSAGQSLFTIYNAEKLIAEFSLKPALASLIKKGHKLVFYKTADKSTITSGSVGMIQPVFKNGENFTLIRVYLTKSSTANPNFRVGELLTANIPVLLQESWWLPESAVVSLGAQTVIFKKEGNVVVPKSVRIGPVIGGMVQIKEDISNWQVSKNAAYLVDSESFINTQ